MQTAVFLIYHGMGHFNACFRLAKILSKDHDVVFAGVEYFEKYVQSQGFIYYPLKTVPFGLGFEKWVNEQEKRRPNYMYCIADRWSDRLYKLRETELQQLMTDLSPNYLFIDSYQSTDFIVLYADLIKLSVKIGFIQTMLPTAIHKNCPPLNSAILPGNTMEVKRAYRSFHLGLFKKRVKQKLLFLGMDDATMIKRRFKRNRIPLKYFSTETTWRGVSFLEIDELVLAPKEFDFENNARACSHYVGFMPDLNRIEVSDMEYFKIDQPIRNKLKATNGALLYCSFGSVEQQETKAIHTFLLNLIDAVRDHNCVLIISANSIHQQITFANIPENVFVLKAAPQLELLARAAVFIHHGGLNSIKESIYNGVPMLVYPFDTNTDRLGNATRVVHHQLGLRGNLLNDSVEDITQKLVDLINNDTYKDNIYALRDKDTQYEGHFLNWFKNLKPIAAR